MKTETTWKMISNSERSVAYRMDNIATVELKGNSLLIHLVSGANSTITFATEEEATDVYHKLTN